MWWSSAFAVFRLIQNSICVGTLPANRREWRHQGSFSRNTRSDVEFPRRGAKRTVGRHSPLSRDRKSLTASTEVLASIDWQPGAVEHRIIFDKFWLCLEWEGSVRRRKFKASPLALRTLLSQLSGRLQLWKCNTSDISWRRPVS